MQGIFRANWVAQMLVGQAAEFYRQLGEQAIGGQERNVRFLQSLFEEGTRQARRQTEANLAMTQELFDRAEDQREALGGVTRNVARVLGSCFFVRGLLR